MTPQEISELTAQCDLQEYRFESHTPIIGPLIARFRSAWHSVAGKWADRAIIRQQTAFNQAFDQRLILADRDLTNLVSTVAELTQEVIQLQHVVAALQVRPDHSLDQRE